MTIKTGKDKILIVDDQPEGIWPLSRHLQQGFDVLCVTTGEEALEIAFSENRPELILLDIMMPDMDGYEVCEKLKADERTQDIPIIFLTGKTAEPEQVKGLGLGAQDYVTKPFSLPVVTARIQSVLNLKMEMDRRLLLKAQLEALNLEMERQVRQKQRELEAAREALKQYEDKWRRLFKEEGEAKAPKRILVVDDNPANVYFLAHHLQSQYEVICTTGAKEALEIAFSDDRPDIILLDIMMPEIDGFEVCSRLKANAETWSIPVIFITALGEEVDEARGLNLGAVDFITKPFSIAVAKSRIEAHLRLKEEMDNRIALARKLEGLNKNLEARIQKKTSALEQAHEDLKASKSKYRRLNKELEQRVADRTAQLEVANKELEAFAYSVSHDLRAPLRHIAGFLELLQKKSATALDEEGRHYMSAISAAAQKMGQLIEDLLFFSRMGRQALSLRQVDLKSMVGEVLDELAPDTAGRTIDWRIGDLPTVGGDAAMLRIVLGNLLSNALKFTRPRQQTAIEIGALPGRTGETVIFIRDNGVGFDMTYADNLFCVFQRLHHADEFEGTGIGLANVRRVITRHGGRTWAEGKVGQGATFFFSLPST